MSANEIIRLAATAGEVMLKNGAETYRIEDTIERIFRAYGFTVTEVFVTTTGIFASAGGLEGNDIHTIVKRVRHRTINLEKITLVNQLSRDIVDKGLTLSEAFCALDEIDTRTPYSKRLLIICTGIGSGAFTSLFGAGLIDMGAAFLVGIVVGILQEVMKKRNVTVFVINMICGVFCGVMTLLLLSVGIGENYDLIIIGSIMPLLPGVAITNAIRDILSGDFMSGTARLMEAVLIAVSIAAGVGAGMALWR